ncbi:MAG: DUF3108 domain-containing protein [Janthinobacterium lividum]
MNLSKCIPVFKNAVLLFAAATALVEPVVTHAAENPRYTVNLPPSAELAYTLKASFSGIPLGGDAKVAWTNEGDGAQRTYQVVTDARAALFGKILDEKSTGAVDAFGLAPASYNQKRYRRDPSSASFDRQGRKISFGESDQTYPIKGGEQDRSSAIWQLISIARGAPAKFKPGSKWTMFVAGQRDAEAWTFIVDKAEKITLAQGETATVHLIKSPPADSKEQRIDIWLAPSLEWYPVRLRYTDGNGDFIEQNLDSVNRK